MKTIAINDDWQIMATSSQFTLQKKELCNPKGGEPYEKWYDHGFHGSMLSALQGYIRHSLDKESSINGMIERIELVVNDVDEFKKKIKK